MAPLDLDLELRLAAFDHVAKLRDRFGGLIPARAITEGCTFRGERQLLWNHQQGIYKPATLGRDGPMLKHGLQELDGDELKSVPHRHADQPDRDLLAVQFDRFRAA